MLLRWWCPSDDKLQDYAVHPQTGWIEKHVARCNTCRRKTNQFKEDEQFLAEFRAAAQNRHRDLGNQSLDQLMDTCQKAQLAAEQQPPRD